jgi:hypothetical protein
MEKEEILQIFRDYISGNAQLIDLEDWVLSHIQAILDSGNQVAVALIDRVDALLIEIGAGITSEEELFNAISSIISDEETLQLDLDITASDISFKVCDISVLSITQSSDSEITAQQAEFPFFQN